MSGERFAIIIVEAHSSQSGDTAAKMNIALSAEDLDDKDEISTEDLINASLQTVNADAYLAKIPEGIAV